MTEPPDPPRQWTGRKLVAARVVVVAWVAVMALVVVAVAVAAVR